MGMTKSAYALAFSLLPRAEELVGDSSADDRAQLASVAEALAGEKGVAEPFVSLAGELIAEGAPDTAARISALWAAVATFGVPATIDRELAGPTDDDVAAQTLELAANAEEAETARWYREEYPAIAAARGERPEDNPTWRELVGAAMSPAAPALSAPSAPFDLDARCDWPEESIRSDYKRFMSSAERELFGASMKAVERFLPAPLDRARYAMQRVIEKRQRGHAA